MPNQIGVPGSSSLIGGPSIGDQVAGETEDQRKKRLMTSRIVEAIAGRFVIARRRLRLGASHELRRLKWI